VSTRAWTSANSAPLPYETSRRFRRVSRKPPCRPRDCPGIGVVPPCGRPQMAHLPRPKSPPARHPPTLARPSPRRSGRRPARGWPERRVTCRGQDVCDVGADRTALHQDPFRFIGARRGRDPPLRGGPSSPTCLSAYLLHRVDVGQVVCPRAVHSAASGTRLERGRRGTPHMGGVPRRPRRAFRPASGRVRDAPRITSSGWRGRGRRAVARTSYRVDAFGSARASPRRSVADGMPCVHLVADCCPTARWTARPGVASWTCHAGPA
jgi:hypothetical protein